MLDDTDVKFICMASKKTVRKWVVSSIRYEFDYDGFFEKKLEFPERSEFGSPFDAYRHAKSILRKYKKQWSDAIVVIEEEVAMKELV